MDANKILSADLLDIVFEGRNKEYGAYDLRKTYPERIKRSMLIMFSLLLVVFGGFFLFGFIKPAPTHLIIDGEVTLRKVPDPPKLEPPPPVIPPPPAHVEPVRMKMFTTPQIVQEDPPEDEKPPEMDKMDNVKIGTANTEGKEDDGKIAPPSDNGKGILNVPVKAEPDEPFTKVEIESTYPGGPTAWTRFLERNLFNNLPQDAIENGIGGSVMIQFIVDVDGTVSHVEALSGPKELQPCAIAVIRKSGKWTPAEQNGRKVKSYKKQMITVKLESN